MGRLTQSHPSQVKDLEAALEALQVENNELNQQSLSERSQLAILASTLKATQEELTVKAVSFLSLSALKRR